MNGTRRIIVHLFTGSITLFIWELEEKNLKLEAVLERHSSTTWRLQTRRVKGQIQSSLNDVQERLQVLDCYSIAQHIIVVNFSHYMCSVFGPICPQTYILA